MKKVAISLLCVILAGAIIFGFIYYNRHLDTTTDLQISKEKASDLNQNVIQLNQKISSLNDQIHKIGSDLDEKKKALESFESQITSKDTLVGTLRDQITMTQTETVHLKSAYDNLISELTELKKNKESLPLLENSILSTDQELSQVEEELGQLETDYKTEIMTSEALKAELSSRGAWVVELQDKLKNSQARILSLESDITKSESEIDTLRNQLSDLRKEKSMAENRVGQLQGKYKTVLGDLNEQKLSKMRITELEENLRTLENDLSEGKKTREALENRLSLKETDITQLRKQLDDSKAWATSLENELGKEQNTREALENRLSLKETDITEFRKQLEDSKAWVTSLENELGKDKGKLEWLQNQHARLAEEKSSVESKLGQMQTTYDELVDDLKKQIQNQEVTIDQFQKKISVSFVDRILFKTGKATITSEGAKVLRKVGKTLKNVKDKKIRVVGHTDNVAIISKSRYYKYPSNWELSAARAARVIRFFQKVSGLDPTTMEAVGRSFYDPIASNETPKGRAQNRRVNIIIAPTF